MNKKEITGPLLVQAITGVSKGVFELVIDRIQTGWKHQWALPGGRPPALNFEDAVIVTLAYLRTGCTQQHLAHLARVSQSTISRAICVLTPVIAGVLKDMIPTAEHAQSASRTSVVLVDGALCPTWSWARKKAMWSGKHKTTGWKITVVTNRAGQLLYATEGLPGSIHDKKALEITHATRICHSAPDVIADRGYIGCGFLTPRKSSKNHPLTEEDERFNKQVSGVRSPVERLIAHLKNWKALHTDYRRPLHTWHDTYKAILGLYFLTQKTHF